MEINEIEAAAEAILFAAGDAVRLDRLSQALGLDNKTARSLMKNLMQKYDSDGHGIMIREIDDGYQMCSKPSCRQFIASAFEPRQKQGLSQAAYETLAIIAYNEPVTKAKIENIRGVNSDSPIARLVERDLITDAGRLESPGRPILYKTTEEFLRSFGLRSVTDLPQPELNIAEKTLDENEDEEVL